TKPASRARRESAALHRAVVAARSRDRARRGGVTRGRDAAARSRLRGGLGRGGELRQKGRRRAWPAPPPGAPSWVDRRRKPVPHVTPFVSARDIFASPKAEVANVMPGL